MRQRFLCQRQGAICFDHIWWSFLCTVFLLITGGVASATLVIADPPPPQEQPTQSYAERPEVQEFIRDLAAGTNHLDAAELTRVFEQITPDPVVLESMKIHAVPKPWPQYRAMFLTERRINGGVGFMKTNAAALALAEKKFGVPPEVITAIVCIETDYGRAPLAYKAVRSLATLGFDYPPRTNYFRRELVQFLLLCKEEKWDPLEIASSRDGGLGLPQFMPTSYRRNAIDFNGDHKRDLLNNADDTIGSIGNYLKLDKWRQPNSALAMRATATGTNYRAFIRQTFPIKKEDGQTIEKWHSLGVEPETSVPADRWAALIEMQGDKEPELWLAFWNFDVVTTYNHNPMYALVVDQLSQEIRKAAAGGKASP